jgi:hypothetical protein
MNLDDLRRELQGRASDPGSTSMDDRLAGVRHKVVVARRRKQAAGGVAALASLAVIGVFWSQLVPGEDGDHVATQEFAELPGQLNGDLRRDAVYNDDGASELQWDLTLDSYKYVATITCQIPDDAEIPNPDQPVQLAWTVGSSLRTEQCGAYGTPTAHATVASRRSDWRGAGVRVGQPFTIDLRLQQGGRDVEIPGARFGVGLYDKTGDRHREDGVVLTEILDIDGERYRLAGQEIRPFEGAIRQVSLRTKEADGQIAVVYGWQAEQPAAPYELRQDGETLRTGYGGSVDGPTLIDGSTSHDLTLRAEGSSVDGVLVLAYYTLDD